MDTKRKSRLFWGALLLGFAGLVIFSISYFSLNFLYQYIEERIQSNAVEPDEREVWRNLEFSRVNRFVVSGDVLMLEGYKDTDCFCVYAFNKFTGEPLWDTEKLAAPHIENLNKEESSSSRIVRAIKDTDIVLIIISFETIYALNVRNGEVIWSANYGLYDSLLSDKLFYLYDEDFSLAALDQSTGKPVWKIPNFVSPSDENPPSLIYFRNGVLETSTFLTDGNLVQHIDADTGEIIEEYKEPELYTEETVYEDDIYRYTAVSSLRGRLSVIDQQTEEVKWEIWFDDYSYVSYLSNPHLPEFQNELMYIVLDSLVGERPSDRWSSAIQAREPDTGEIVWQFNEDHRLGLLFMALEVDHMLVIDQTGTILSLDPLTGEVLWSNELSNKPERHFAAEDYYLIITEVNHIYAIKKTTGEILWHFYEPIELREDHDGELITYSTDPYVDFYDGLMFVSTVEPYVYAIDLPSGAELWNWSNGKVPGESFNHRHEIELVADDLLFVSQNGDIFVFDVSDMK